LVKAALSDAFGNDIFNLKRRLRAGKAKTARPGTLAPAGKALQHPNRRIVYGLDSALYRVFHGKRHPDQMGEKEIAISQSLGERTARLGFHPKPGLRRAAFPLPTGAGAKAGIYCRSRTGDPTGAHAGGFDETGSTRRAKADEW
jgi:hypothetical protein